MNALIATAAVALGLWMAYRAGRAAGYKAAAAITAQLLILLGVKQSDLERVTGIKP